MAQTQDYRASVDAAGAGRRDHHQPRRSASVRGHVPRDAHAAHPGRQDTKRSADQIATTAASRCASKISVFCVATRSAGEMALQPTTDIVFFPALFTLTPAEERSIRVGSRVTSTADVEQTYRISSKSFRRWTGRPMPPRCTF